MPMLRMCAKRDRSDLRIGFSFIFPGCGYGGSCFPKDVKAILGMARDVEFSPILMQAVEDRNQNAESIVWLSGLLRVSVKIERV